MILAVCLTVGVKRRIWGLSPLSHGVATVHIQKVLNRKTTTW